MSLRALLSERGSVIPRVAGSADRRGNPVDAFDTANKRPYPCRLEQTDSEEIQVDRDTVISNWRLFLPPDAQISARDHWEQSDGRTFEVIGAPAIESTPRGPHHIEARLRFIDD